MTATHTLPGSVREATLYVAFELGAKTWKLGVTSGFGVEPWITSVAAGDWARVREGLAKAKRRFGLPAAAVVVSCYEAGRDGFWIHRALTREGIRNRVVDSASIEVNRRQRRAKTDRLDARKLVAMLVRAWLGERDVWREVRGGRADVGRELGTRILRHWRVLPCPVGAERGFVDTCGVVRGYLIQAPDLLRPPRKVC